MIRKFILAALLLCAPSVYAQGTISAMTAASALSGTELFECVQSGSKKCTANQIKTFTSTANTFTGHQLFSPDNTYDIGANGATRPLNGYFSGVVSAQTFTTLNGGAFINSESGLFYWASRAVFSSPADGVVRLTNNVQTDFSRLQLGGTTSSFPAIKRSAATIAFRLADDSADAAISASTLALGGATIGSNALAVTGIAAISGGFFTGSSASSPGLVASGMALSVQRYDAGDTAALGLSVMTATGGGLASMAVARGIGLQIGSTNSILWSSTTAYNGTADLYLTRAAAATLQQGAANAASPVAQTLQAQGSRSGTDTNVGGANYTHASGNGTGTGTLSQFIISTPVAVASGTGAQTITPTLTLGNGVFTIGSNVVTPASSGTRYLCISTAGVVTSSASACSGT